VKARHSVIVCGALLTGDRPSEPPRAADPARAALRCGLWSSQII
jgi:hypothetical protein